MTAALGEEGGGGVQSHLQMEPLRCERGEMDMRMSSNVGELGLVSHPSSCSCWKGAP
jgi:hypothetical protein